MRTIHNPNDSVAIRGRYTTACWNKPYIQAKRGSKPHSKSRQNVITEAWRHEILWTLLTFAFDFDCHNLWGARSFSRAYDFARRLMSSEFRFWLSRKFENDVLYFVCLACVLLLYYKNECECSTVLDYLRNIHIIRLFLFGGIAEKEVRDKP